MPTSLCLGDSASYRIATCLSVAILMNESTKYLGTLNQSWFFVKNRLGELMWS